MHPGAAPGTGVRTGRSSFFYIASAVQVLLALAFLCSTVNFVRVGGQKRADGWTALFDPRTQVWRVSTVDASGPAAATLRPGDNVLALNNDANPRIAPATKLSAIPPGTRYSLSIARASDNFSVDLTVSTAPDPSAIRYFLIQMLIAATCWSTALLFLIYKPDDPTAQRAFIGTSMFAAFALSMSMNPLSGTLTGGWWTLALVLYSVVPLHLVYLYRFFVQFPPEAPPSRFFGASARALTIAAFAIWVPCTIFNAFRAAHLETVALSNIYYKLLSPLASLVMVWAMSFTIAVVVRNYRALPEGNPRRRLRWIVWGTIAGSCPVVVIGMAWFVAQATGRVVGIGSFETPLAIGNALTILGPIAMAYAILKHRVMGFRVFLRLGLQYLLAKNVLRLLVFLPLAGIAYVVVNNPDKTISQLLLGGAAKFNLVLIAITVAALQYRDKLGAWIDRRFFRETYDREQILLRQIDLIKDAETMPDISRVLSEEIVNALHASWISVLYRDGESQDLSIAYSSMGSRVHERLPELSGLLSILEQHRRCEEWSGIRHRCPPTEAEWIDQHPVALLVPVFSLEQNLLGVLMLGEKQSEEPYSPSDRALLEALSAQIGVAYENLSLRQRVKREQLTQQHVLARLDERQVNVVKECPLCGTCYDSSAKVCELDGRELQLTLPVERVVDGKYRLVRLIGRGGMGAVYEAADLRLNRTVAVKVMIGSLFGNVRAIRRFSREARASAKLDHVNIVRVYDFGELRGDGAYLVLEFVQGVTWRRLLKSRGAFPPEQAQELLDGLFSGMEAAHRAEVLHRDLKPENVLLTQPRDGRPPVVKILDFGLAKVRELEHGDKSLTLTGMAVGTYGYMSPEQFMGEQDVDERTDVFSLGVIALESLSGNIKVQGHSFHAQLDELLYSRFKFAGVTDQHMAVHAILAKSMAAARENRYPSVAALRKDLIPAIRICPAFPPAERVRSFTSPGGTMADDHPLGGQTLTLGD